MRFIRRATTSDFTQSQDFTATIDEVEYTATIDSINGSADTALEVELDDGSVVVLLGYLRK